MKTFKLLAALLLFSYSLAGFSKTLVITDIDDTIKKANSMGGVGGVYHFLKKKPYNETRDLFNEIRKDEIARGNTIGYFYVSAAPSFTFDAQEWITKNNFPAGPSYLKTKENGGETYAYKYRTIKTIIENALKKDNDLKIIFFGDNSQHDAKVYYDLNLEMNLGSEIFIRDVSTEATYFSSTLPLVRLPGVHYFFSEMELINHPSFLFMSSNLKNLIHAQYSKQDLVPPYTLDTLVDRLKDICESGKGIITEDKSRECKQQAKKDAGQYWEDYYTRF